MRCLIAILLTIVALVVIDRTSLLVACAVNNEINTTAKYTNQEQPDKKPRTYTSGMITAGINLFADMKAEEWTAAATVAIAGFTIILAIVGYTQAKLTRAALELARGDFISTHRPRIIVRIIQGPFRRRDDNQFVWINIVNIGPTTAIIRELGFDLARRKGKLWCIPGADGAPKQIDPIKLISGERHTFEVSAKAAYTEAEIFADALDIEEICAFGAIRYGDENGIVRETGFFRIYDPKSEKFIPSKDPGEEYQD